MSLLLNGDCLEQLSNVDDNSVDFIFCDLPYGQTSCKWDIIVPWEPFWKEIMRVKKINTPVFFTTTTKFGVQLINSAPKKMPFRYDLVWVKSAPAGFLSAKKMPMRKHEMVYAFYEKLPFYDLSSHQHKFKKQEIKEEPTNKKDLYGIESGNAGRKKGFHQTSYDPPLPVSVVKEEYDTNEGSTMINGTLGGAYDSRWQKGHQGNSYDPPLPTSVVKEDNSMVVKNKSIYHNKDVIDYKDRKGGPMWDPPLPTSIVKEDLYGQTCDDKNNYEESVGMNKKERKEVRYDPPLPTTMLEIKSTRGKHSTEKPVALMEWLLKYYSKEGDTVLDPTMGSGSTGVACKNMKRNFIGIEKDPDIYKVAVNRIED